MKPLLLIIFAGLFLSSNCFGVSLKNIQLGGTGRLRNGDSQDLSYYENLTTTEIIESFGYVTETHHVVTEDGYILELHRIPYGINGTSGGQRPVAFLHHCLECSSADWVVDKPDRALGYILADAGYDVWLTNVRGNTYSRNHTTLNPDVDADKEQFWAFTFNEMALYDAPAAIDYALATTGNSQLYYVGFSMGTSVFFAMMSERNEYKDKIKAAALLGPVAYNDHCTGPMRLLGNYSDNMDALFSDFGHYEFWPSNDMWQYIADNFCAVGDPAEPACEYMIFLFCGYDEEELNDDYLPIYISHTPAGTSVHVFNHYGQLIAEGTFQMYNWGTEGNLEHYGQPEPPLYDLQVDTPPLALYWGEGDPLANPTDVARLASELKNVVVNQKVAHEQWSHMDFVWAIHAKEYVYDYVLDFFSNY